MNRLAIVIPYYKFSFFKETLLSVAKQTDTRFTLYIGNDASPNDPKPLLDETLDGIPFQYFNYKTNLGSKNLSAQWERILENVTEEWFQILGDDDLISENFVEEFYRSLDDIEKNGCSVIKYSHRWIDEHGNPTNNYSNYPKLLDPFKAMYQNVASLSEHVFKTEIWQKLKFKKMPLAWTSDNLAVLDFSLGKPVYFIDRAKVEVRISNENISGKEEGQELKKLAKHLYGTELLNNYYKKLEKKTVASLLGHHVYYCRHNQVPISVNLFKLYFYLKDYKKLSLAPYEYLKSFRNSKYLKD